jgi:hypothetical protein
MAITATEWLTEWQPLLDDHQAARKAVPPERKLQGALAAFQAAAAALGQPLFVPCLGPPGPTRETSCWLKCLWGYSQRPDCFVVWTSRSRLHMKRSAWDY